MSLRLLLPRPILAAMIDQARAELPNECCGLLAGRLSMVTSDAGQTNPACRVDACYPLVNAAASTTEYESDAHSIFAAVRDMRLTGLDIVAVYHSHPTSRPIPSR